MSLDNLYETLRMLEAKRDKFFDGDDYPNKGDQFYQDLLQQIEDVEDEIEELENQD